MIPLHLFESFPWICLHHRQFSSCFCLPHISLLQELEGFPTGSALPGPEVINSPTQQHMCSSFTTWWDPKWVLLLKQGTKSVWPVPQAPRAPLSFRFLSQPNCGCRFFLQTANPPDLMYPFCPATSSLLSHPPHYMHPMFVLCFNSPIITSVY